LIRKATRADIPRIMEIRAAVRENRLRDPSRVTVDHVAWPGTRAESFYRQAGWRVTGHADDNLVFAR
jgi:hypothetical protein